LTPVRSPVPRPLPRDVLGAPRTNPERPRRVRRDSGSLIVLVDDDQHRLGFPSLPALIEEPPHRAEAANARPAPQGSPRRRGRVPSPALRELSLTRQRPSNSGYLTSLSVTAGPGRRGMVSPSCRLSPAERVIAPVAEENCAAPKSPRARRRVSGRKQFSEVASSALSVAARRVSRRTHESESGCPAAFGAGTAAAAPICCARLGRHCVGPRRTEVRGGPNHTVQTHSHYLIEPHHPIGGATGRAKTASARKPRRPSAGGAVPAFRNRRSARPARWRATAVALAVADPDPPARRRPLERAPRPHPGGRRRRSPQAGVSHPGPPSTTASSGNHPAPRKMVS